MKYRLVFLYFNVIHLYYIIIYRIFAYQKQIIMNEQIKEFLNRLRTVKSKACDERITVKTVHDRAKKGIYQMIEIDGVKFIVEPLNKVQ